MFQCSLPELTPPVGQPYLGQPCLAQPYLGQPYLGQAPDGFILAETIEATLDAQRCGYHTVDEDRGFT